MPAEIRVFRCLSDNIGALIHDPATGACAAVDAPEEAPIVKALEETGWTLSEIIVTHRHADHVQAIEPLKRRTGCRVVAPERRVAKCPWPTPMSARAIPCGWESLRRTSGRRPAIAPTTSPTGSRPTGRCLPVTPSSRSAADG